MRQRKRLPLEALAPFLLEPPCRPAVTQEPPRTIDWVAVFGNSRPVELEVGFGKGLFLLTAAQERPEINFVGIEIDRGLQLYAATRLAKRNLRNARVAKADARLFLSDCVADESVTAVHVYFPDPWWKKRHKKRRVFTVEFARQCERILRAGGRLRIATDVEEYFQVMTGLVAEHTGLREISRSETGDVAVAGEHRTNFERKALQQGRSVWQAEYLK